MRLRHEGWRVNHKKVKRIYYRNEGLSLRRRRQKKLAAGLRFGVWVIFATPSGNVFVRNLARGCSYSGACLAVLYSASTFSMLSRNIDHLTTSGKTGESGVH